MIKLYFLAGFLLNQSIESGVILQTKFIHCISIVLPWHSHCNLHSWRLVSVCNTVPNVHQSNPNFMLNHWNPQDFHSLNHNVPSLVALFSHNFHRLNHYVSLCSILFSSFFHTFHGFSTMFHHFFHHFSRWTLPSPDIPGASTALLQRRPVFRGPAPQHRRPRRRRLQVLRREARRVRGAGEARHAGRVAARLEDLLGRPFLGVKDDSVNYHQTALYF